MTGDHSGDAGSAARADLDRMQQRRLVAGMLADGNSEDAVARSLGITLATVERVQRQIRAGLDVNEVTPAEIINEYAVGEIDEASMIDRLLAMDLTLGTHDPTGGGGYVRGSWDDVHAAVGRGLITDEQYNRLASERSR